MSYLSCRSIIPKFLWKHIIEYMSYESFLKMIVINKHFDVLIDENAIKSRFIEDRSDAIVIVKCKSKRVDYFWKYTMETYIACASIRELFQYIDDDDDNKESTAMVYYKIFIKEGEYVIGRQYFTFNHNPCSIEINGAKSGLISESSKRIPTTSYIGGRHIPETHLFPGGAKIKYDFTNNDLLSIYTLGIKISRYFSVKYITFCDVSCIFEADKDRSINDKDFAIIHYYSQLHLHSCTFAGYDTCLTIDSINKSIIINCAMVSFLRIFGSINTAENMISNICDISYSIIKKCA